MAYYEGGKYSDGIIVSSRDVLNHWLERRKAGGYGGAMTEDVEELTEGLDQFTDADSDTDPSDFTQWLRRAGLEADYDSDSHIDAVRRSSRESRNGDDDEAYEREIRRHTPGRESRSTRLSARELRSFVEDAVGNLAEEYDMDLDEVLDDGELRSAVIDITAETFDVDDDMVDMVLDSI